MKLINKTDWQTSQIRALLYEVCRRELLPSSFTKRLNVTVKYGRKRMWSPGYGGYAWYNSTSMILKLPRGGPLETNKIALIMGHELAHCQGMRHGKAMKANYGWMKGWQERWAWANEWKIEKNIEPPKPTVIEKVEKKLDECHKAVARWERKLQFAKTWLKKWERKVKYLETKAAALKNVRE